MCSYCDNLLDIIISRPQVTHFWGRSCTGSDAFVREILGDGKQMFFLEALNTRPWCHVIRVDSSWSSDDIGEHDEEILQAIEMEYGNADDEWCPEDDDDVEPEDYGDFPMLNTGSGYTWGTHHWPSLSGEWQSVDDYILDSESA